MSYENPHGKHDDYGIQNTTMLMLLSPPLLDCCNSKIWKFKSSTFNFHNYTKIPKWHNKDIFLCIKFSITFINKATANNQFSKFIFEAMKSKSEKELLWIKKQLVRLHSEAPRVNSFKFLFLAFTAVTVKSKLIFVLYFCN